MTYRIAILGDFSGRAARGIVEGGDALAARRPIPLDIDTLEDVIAGFGLTLTLPLGEDGVAVPLPDLDALHPDALFEGIALFGALGAIRRRLKSGATAAEAATALAALGAAVPPLPAPPPSRAARVPADRTLTDFQALIGGTAAEPAAPSPVDALVARVIGPHVVAAPDPGAPAMLAATDAALSSAMNLILHHPEVQALEAAWRQLEFLARRIETGDGVTLTVYDISAEELGADLAGADAPGDSGLYRLLTDARPGAEGYDLIAGLYTFEKTPPHADLIARLGAIGAALGAPVLAAVDLDTLGPGAAAADAAWQTLQSSDSADWVGLGAPAFLLRRPYGRKTDPIDRFDYEEFDQNTGLSALLWANPVTALVTLLAASGGPGATRTLDDLAYLVVPDAYGDPVQLPTTARAMTEARVRAAEADGVMPLQGIKGRDQAQVPAFLALSGRALPGPSTPASPRPAARAATLSATLSAGDLAAMRAARTPPAGAPPDPEAVDPELAQLLRDL
ncbi:MAG: type VI secretion system contractile sheath large subunit [Pseudomonadota bacterium]